MAPLFGSKLPCLHSDHDDGDQGHSHRVRSPRLTTPISYALTGLGGLLALSRTPRLSNGVHFELDALVLLNAADDLEKIAGVGIAVRSEHAHETLGRFVRQ